MPIECFPCAGDCNSTIDHAFNNYNYYNIYICDDEATLCFDSAVKVIRALCGL